MAYAKVTYPDQTVDTHMIKLFHLCIGNRVRVHATVNILMHDKTSVFTAQIHVLDFGITDLGWATTTLSHTGNGDRTRVKVGQPRNFLLCYPGPKVIKLFHAHLSMKF